MNASYFDIQNFSIEIEGMKVLNEINVKIPENQITVIIGPSGCGKSTLLNSMNRLIDLTDGVRTSGEILLQNKNIFDQFVDVTELRRRVGMISQTPNPLPMSIFDNIAYGLKIHGIGDKSQVSSTCRTMSEYSRVME